MVYQLSRSEETYLGASASSGHVSSWGFRFLLWLCRLNLFCPHITGTRAKCQGGAVVAGKARAYYSAPVHLPALGPPGKAVTKPYVLDTQAEEGISSLPFSLLSQNPISMVTVFL